MSVFDKAVEAAEDDAGWEERILGILERRSMSLEDIVRVTGMPYLKAKSRLSALERQGIVKSYYFGDNMFFLKS